MARCFHENKEAIVRSDIAVFMKTSFRELEDSWRSNQDLVGLTTILIYTSFHENKA